MLPTKDALYYLANPYTDPDADVRQERYEAAVDLCASLARDGFHVLSPIVHWHPVAVTHDMPTEFDFWQKQDQRYIDNCDAVAVFCLPGWEESRGVQSEIAYASTIGIPVHYIKT